MKPITATLDLEKIIDTIEQLRRRIQDRFPGSGLQNICSTCLSIAEQARERAEFIDRPVYWLRLFIVVLILGLFSGLAMIAVFLPQHLLRVTENWETIEALTNESLLLAAGLFFLVTLENRLKRLRALSAIHELRALAHVIDMHQLTKDPERLLPNWIESDQSPSMTMSAFELGRYLDYCGELLSLLSKLSAIYVQRFDDEVALQAVNEVEMLTSSLCERIWQKGVFLNSIAGQISPTSSPRSSTAPMDGSTTITEVVTSAVEATSSSPPKSCDTSSP